MRASARHLEATVLGAIFLAKLALLLWALDRGLGVGDEGFFLLMIEQPETAPPLFAVYQLLGLLESPPQIGRVAARGLRLSVELLALAGLCAGLLSWSRSGPLARGAGKGSGSGPLLVAFCLLGAFLSAGSRAVSYNDLTNLCTYGAAGCFFHVAALAPEQPVDRGRWLAVLAMGFLVGCQLFVKFPPALFLLAAIPLLLPAALPSLPLRSGLALLGVWAGGLVAALTLLVPGLGGLAALAERWSYAEEINRLTGYSVPAILLRYLRNDLATYVNLGGFLLLFALSLAALRVALGAASPSRRDLGLAGALLVAALPLSLSVLFIRPEFVNSSLLYLVCLTVTLSLLCGLLVAFAAADAAHPSHALRRLAPLLLLLALPLANTLGTNVSLTLRLPSHIAPLFALLALLLPPLRDRGYRLFGASCLLLLIAVTSVAFVRHQLLQPYGLPGPIHEQSVAAPAEAGVKVDRRTRDFLAELSATLGAAGLRPGDPVIALDFAPGLVHYLRARSPGFPFYARGNTELNCFLINRGSSQATPFLLASEPISEELRACIEAFRFPDDFQLLATLENPYARAYEVFFDAPYSPRLHLFGPRP